MKRFAGGLLVALAVVAGLWLLSRARTPAGTGRADAVTLVATLRSEPRSFNRLLASDRGSLAVSQLIHEPLVRVNHATQALEPALAASWTDAEALTVRLTLRPEARFSDGTPVTAADVVFSLEAAYDERLGSAVRDSLLVHGQPIAARTVDTRTVDLQYPAPYGPGLRPLHGLPILPRARYAPALADGTLAPAWATDAAPDGMVGAGPFIVDRHDPGVAVHLKRNPHYWRRADDGTPLPRVDALRLDIVPSQDAEMLRLRNGDADVTTAELRPDDLPEARALAAQGRLQVFDLGPSLEADMLWFNLAPGDVGRDWLRRRELREAIAHAVDRAAFINAVYRGAAVQVASVITPGNVAWHADDIQPRPYSRELAGELLDRIGVRDRDGDGMREDVYGAPASFTLLVQQGHTIRQRAATVLQEALRAIGLRMDIASVDARGLQERLGKGAYEAMYHALPGTDTDPSGLMELWLSSGHFHLWNPAQPEPATEWEAEIDRLMRRQLQLTDQQQRRALVVEAQHILDRELPIIVFAAPRVSVATSRRLTHVRPGLLSPHVLWNAAELGVR